MKLFNYFTSLAIVFCLFLFATACQNNKGYEFPNAPEQVFLTEKKHAAN